EIPGLVVLVQKRDVRLHVRVDRFEGGLVDELDHEHGASVAEWRWYATCNSAGEERHGIEETEPQSATPREPGRARDGDEPVARGREVRNGHTRCVGSGRQRRARAQTRRTGAPEQANEDRTALIAGTFARARASVERTSLRVACVRWRPRD